MKTGSFLISGRNETHHVTTAMVNVTSPTTLTIIPTSAIADFDISLPSSVPSAMTEMTDQTLVTGASTPMRMAVTKTKITSVTINTSFSSTKPSKKSNYLLLLYLLPSLLIILTCFTIIIMYIILKHRRRYKQNDIVDQDSSVMLGIPSVDVSKTRNNDTTAAVSLPNSSTSFLSSSVKPINKTALFDDSNKLVAHTFDDSF
jgi:hypothetical protein